MSDILIKRLKESEGKTVTIFLHNNFRYTGRCLASDERYIELLDYKINRIKVIDISEIKDLEVGE